ncbi:antitoxin [uncultured Sphingomonas sp.]|uniref:antitoxin n=1 Tax=uncultured Sphingomonas sp. TaxID=158754 RepID=UPI0035C9729C
MAQPSTSTNVREAKLFRNNRSQAVRIPAEFEFPGNRVLIRKEGTKLIIEPEPKTELIDVLRSLSPLKAEDDFPANLDVTLKPLKAVNL